MYNINWKVARNSLAYVTSGVVQGYILSKWSYITCRTLRIRVSKGREDVNYEKASSSFWNGSVLSFSLSLSSLPTSPFFSPPFLLLPFSISLFLFVCLLICYTHIVLILSVKGAFAFILTIESSLALTCGEHHRNCKLHFSQQYRNDFCNLETIWLWRKRVSC